MNKLFVYLLKHYSMLDKTNPIYNNSFLNIHDFIKIYDKRKKKLIVLSHILMR